MSLEQTLRAASVLESRQRYVARGVATPRLVVARPKVNVVALFVIAVSIIPVWIAQRITAEPGAVRPGVGTAATGDALGSPE